VEDLIEAFVAGAVLEAIPRYLVSLGPYLAEASNTPNLTVSACWGDVMIEDRWRLRVTTEVVRFGRLRRINALEFYFCPPSENVAYLLRSVTFELWQATAANRFARR
jgi:hypothetical protein